MNFPLRIYNTQTRKKEIFTPLKNNEVSMYVCGPTVYNYIHIGNARPNIVFDVLFRVLKLLYPKVTYARNITDIDDKIMNAARESGESIGDISTQFTKAFHEDLTELNTLAPSIEPLATDHIDTMINMVSTLVEKAYAYVADDHVLFNVKAMEDYGELSKRNLDEMLEGARVDVADYKKYAGDFVLWKPSADNEPGWDSPWGKGRPGWHLECSAMIEKHFGNTIDIHGGGRDLVFPHHENELAQSRCAHDGETYVRYWMHNGYINIDGEKMSKSLGNFRTVRDLLTHFSGETIRYALLTAQYRSELDFSESLLQQSKKCVDTLYTALRRVENVPALDETEKFMLLKQHDGWAALLDDLNTPIAIAELFALAKKLNKADLAKDADDIARDKTIMLALGELLGILQKDPSAWFQEAGTAGREASSTDLSSDDVNALVDERIKAKADKNYQRADEIRTQLKDAGIVLEDAGMTTTWKRN